MGSTIARPRMAAQPTGRRPEPEKEHTISTQPQHSPVRYVVEGAFELSAPFGSTASAPDVLRSLGAHIGEDVTILDQPTTIFFDEVCANEPHSHSTYIGTWHCVLECRIEDARAIFDDMLEQTLFGCKVIAASVDMFSIAIG